MASKEIITGCRMDCPDACSLVVTGTEKKWKIRGNPDHPITRGFTCKKVGYFLKRHFSSSRFTRPMIKKNGKWKEISAEDAIEICASRIESLINSPERILHIQGHGIRGVFVDSVQYFFEALGSSKVRGSLCDDAGIEAFNLDFGALDHNDIRDITKSDFIVNWGKDAKRSSIHTAALLKKARKSGAKVITISPGGCDLNGVCDFHILIKPGTDRFLALGVIKELLKIKPELSKSILSCPNGDAFIRILNSYEIENLLNIVGITYSELAQIKEIYVSNSRVSTLIGWGIQRHAFGGETVRWINALAYLSGHIGRSGNGVYYNVSSRRHFNYEGIAYPENGKRKGRTFSLPRIGSEILKANPPVEMLWINGTNIVNQAPDSRKVAEALNKVSFTVVVDAFFTDTARNADLFLPCSLMWEEEDIVGSAMHNFVNYCAPFIKRPDGVFSDREWIEKINDLLSQPVKLPSRKECYERAFSSPSLEHTSFDELKEAGFVECRHPEIAFPDGRTAHHHGKINLVDRISPPPSQNARYPLLLLSLIRRNYLHSQILPEDHTQPVVYVSVDCPGSKNIEDGKNVRLVSPLGSLIVKLKKLPVGAIHPQVVIYRRDDWASLGGGVNQIIADHITDIGETAAYYSQCVRLEPL